MSYVTSYSGGTGETVQGLGNFIPGWLYAGRKISESSYTMASLDGAKAMLAASLGVVAVMLMVVKLHELLMPKSGMTTQWLGVRHPGDIRLSDSSMMGSTAGRRDKADTFLGRGVGPEFVEQPNYVLGNENMMRTALAKYNRLKMSGAAVGTWPVFWAAYKAENSDDLDSSMYDFGDGFDAKKLHSAGMGL